MPRCVAFAPELTPDTETLALNKSESHHIVRVLRARAGQAVTVLNGQGVRATCELLEPNAQACALRILETRVTPAALYDLVLVPAVIKGKSMDNLIRMATELGVSAIQPLFTQNGDVPLSAFDSGSKLEKWRTVATEACKQCENPWLPEIRNGLSLTAWLAQRSAEADLVFGSLEADARDFRGWREAFEKSVRMGRPLELTIGPEGDFSPEEYQLMRNAGGFAVFLGRCILRSETATPALLAGLIATLPSQ